MTPWGDGMSAALMAGMRLPSIVYLLPLAALAVGCSAASSSDGASAPPPSSTTTTTGDAQRAIEEADIIQIQSGRLYALSKTGTVSVIDVSVPGALTLLGQTTLAGQPFEMYLRGSALVVMSNGAVTTSGYVSTTYQSPDSGSGAMVAVVDVSVPARLATVATLKVPGEIADSRVVGQVLYMATYENASCYGCGSAPRTMVTSFDITTPTAIRQVEQVSFQSDAPDGYNLPWGSNWKRSIFVTDQRLYIGGHADIAPNGFGTANEGIIDVLDVTDPGGRLGVGARLSVAGAILSRWQLDEQDGVLRVISQRGAGRTGNGLADPAIDTFRIDSTQSFVALGHAPMSLPQPEGLRTVRFDGPRAYAITYNQTDPMFVIDLSDPKYPRQRRELYMPGFMYYLEPHGDRVIGLGIDRNDPGGSLNVSLFDVSDADAPRMLSRVPFATAGITEDYEILNGEVAEDQDRIQKAFRVFPDGLVVVPFSGLRPYSYYQTNTGCDNEGGGVQLVTWQSDTLTKQALLPLPGNPRRAFENGNELIAVSDSNVRAFALDNLRAAHETADLVIGTCTAPTPVGYYGGYDGYSSGRASAFECSAAPGNPAPGGWAAAVLVAALALAWARGRARAGAAHRRVPSRCYR